jgi:hypothetical protein
MPKSTILFFGVHLLVVLMVLISRVAISGSMMWRLPMVMSVLQSRYHFIRRIFWEILLADMSLRALQATS